MIKMGARHHDRRDEKKINLGNPVRIGSIDTETALNKWQSGIHRQHVSERNSRGDTGNHDNNSVTHKLAPRSNEPHNHQEAIPARKRSN